MTTPSSPSSLCNIYCRGGDPPPPAPPPPHPPTPLLLDDSNIIINEHIGHGSFGLVFNGIYKGEEIALKFFHYDGLNNNAITDQHDREISLNEIVRDIDGIVQFKGIFYDTAVGRLSEHRFVKSDPGLYPVIIFKLYSGGDLLERISYIRKNNMKPYHENLVRGFVVQQVNTLIQVHARGLIHRDIKPENYFCDSRNILDLGRVYLGDLGLMMHTREIAVGFSGSPKWSAPEALFHRNFSFSSDIYGLGLVIYALLTLHHPFQLYYSAKFKAELPVNYRTDVFSQFQAGLSTNNVNHDLTDLLRRMLDVDNKNRITSQDILAHPWITKMRTGNDN